MPEWDAEVVVDETLARALMRPAPHWRRRWADSCARWLLRARVLALFLSATLAFYAEAQGLRALRPSHSPASTERSRNDELVATPWL